MIDKDRLTAQLQADFPACVEFTRAILVAERVFSRIRGRRLQQDDDVLMLPWDQMGATLQHLCVAIAQEALVESIRLRDEKYAAEMKDYWHKQGLMRG